jgi:hypothetical protein
LNVPYILAKPDLFKTVFMGNNSRILPGASVQYCSMEILLVQPLPWPLLNG